MAKAVVGDETVRVDELLAEWAYVDNTGVVDQHTALGADLSSILVGQAGSEIGARHNP